MTRTPKRTRAADRDPVALPRPRRGGMPLAEAIEARRSHREFDAAPLTRRQVGQLCWAGQGVTDDGLRAAPSAGGLHPMTLYLVDAAGVCEYVPEPHALRRVRDGDVRADLAAAALDQECVADAPLVIVIAMRVAKTARRYGEWARGYCLMEAGHIAQNVLLQATALGLGSVPVAAFEPAAVASVLSLPRGREPAYMVSVGVPARDAP